MTIIDGGNAFTNYGTTGGAVGQPIVAAYLPTYAAREPYLTTAEFLATPTGVTVSSLVTGGNAAQNADALAQMLLRASGAVDSYCHQVLAATIEVQVGTYLCQGGRLNIPVNQSPVIQVNGLSYGQPGYLTALSDLTGTTIDEKVVSLPVTPTWVGRTGRVRAELTYIAGFANSLLTIASAVAATTFTVDSTLGYAPGLGITFSDPQGGSEVLTVLTVPSGTTFTTVTGAAYAHGTGVSVGAMPAAVKQATALIATALIRNRGAEAMVLNSMRAQPTGTAPLVAPASRGLITTAQMMLEPFTAV